MPQRNVPQRKLLYALLCLIILLPMAGCSAIVTDAQAPGTYKADTDWGVATITLASNNTFSEVVIPKNGQPRQLSGHWRISQSGKNPTYTTISLTPFYIVTHDKEGQYTLATASSIYHVPFGGINIAADPDAGIAFRK
jgi:hypothetical protein